MRQTGRTTEQMRNAPRGAVFVWVNHHLDYPKALARKLERADLRIESPSFFEGYRWAGLELSGIVIDHAAALTDAQNDGYAQARIRIRRTAHEVSDA